MQHFRRSFSLDEYALGVVDDPALQSQLFREPEDERAKAYALHRASYGDPDALNLHAAHSFRLPFDITSFCDQ